MFILSIFNTQETLKHNLFNKDKAGFYVWSIMHLYSAFIPEIPTEQEQEEIGTLVELLGKYFPCKECSAHFKEMIIKNPVQAQTRGDFMNYVCKIHNIVNQRIGKEIFPCENIKEIWG